MNKARILIYEVLTATPHNLVYKQIELGCMLFVIGACPAMLRKSLRDYAAIAKSLDSAIIVWSPFYLDHGHQPGHARDIIFYPVETRTPPFEV